MSEMAFRIYDACDGRGIHALPDSTPRKVSICDTAWNLLWEVLRRKWLLRVEGNKNIQWGELESYRKTWTVRITMETLEPILAEHPLFSGMEQEHLQILVGCARNVRFESEDVIFREGEKANEFYLIRTGKVALQLFADRRGPLTILTLEEGDVLGWSWLSPPYHWKFTARALETTRAISLDGKCIREKAETDHDLGYELLKRFVHVIEERVRATTLQLLNVYER